MTEPTLHDAPDSPLDESPAGKPPVTVRPVNDGDFFEWLALYEEYAADNDTVLTDEKVLRLWIWLSDDAHEEIGRVALVDDRIVGLVNFHEFSRPLASDKALFIDDLYVRDSVRQAEVGSALIEAVRSWGANSGASAVQWAAAPEESSWGRFDDDAEPSRRITYELPIAP